MDTSIYTEPDRYDAAKKQKQALFFELLANQVNKNGNKWKNPNHAICQCSELIEREFDKFDQRWLENEIILMGKYCTELKNYKEVVTTWNSTEPKPDQVLTVTRSQEYKTLDILPKSIQIELKEAEARLLFLKEALTSEQKRKKLLPYATSSRDESLIKLLRKYKAQYSKFFIDKYNN